MELITRNVCKASNIGVHGNLFGGTMLSWIDEAGAILASNICNTNKMVTLKMSEVVFKKSVKTGNQIWIYGKVVSIGNTSITLELEARQNDVYSSRQKAVCTTKVTFVRIDDDGDPTPISSRVKKKHEKLMSEKQETTKQETTKPKA